MGATGLNWSSDLHERTVADADVVGFGDDGVWLALGDGTGGLAQARLALTNFGRDQDWTVPDYPRLLADLDGDGRADVVGFGGAGVWTALRGDDASYGAARLALPGFCYDQGWRADRHVRTVADLAGHGRRDVLGFGDDGVWTALGDGAGGLDAARFVLAGFCIDQGWQPVRHPRLLADLAGHGPRDIVGFGDAGVWTALGDGSGGFEPARYVLADFGVEQGWDTTDGVDHHPRFVVDLTGHGSRDIVGFGDAGVWTALGDGSGGFGPARYVLADFGTGQGWRGDLHPRFLTDLTGDGVADIVGFGEAGVWTALGDGSGGFGEARYVLASFGVEDGWHGAAHPRLVADLAGHGTRDVVGFGDAGVWTALGDGHGGFEPARFVLADFGPTAGSAGVEHIFVLMLENRSFDHVLGFSGITGTDAETGEPTAIEGLTGTESNSTGGETFPVTRGAPDTPADDPIHGFPGVLLQLGGEGTPHYDPATGYPPVTNAGFAFCNEHYRSDGPGVMRCHTPDEVPVLVQMASEFAVCDHWFCSMPGPTWPNRLFLQGGSSSGLDHPPSWNQITWWEGFEGFEFAHGTIYDALDRRGAGYRLYCGDTMAMVSSLKGIAPWDVHDIEDLAEDLKDGTLDDVRYIHIEPDYDWSGDFANGTSQHPRSTMSRGEDLIKSVYEQLRSSPLWPSSMLIVTYDEHGGFYDHVPPPRAIPPGDPDTDDDYNESGFLFDQLGPRVPAVVVSPLIPRNLVDHRVYDHTSVLKTLERNLSMPALTHRDDAAASLTTLLRLPFPRTDTPEVLGEPAATRRVPPPTVPDEAPVDDEVEPFLIAAAVQRMRLEPAAAHDRIRAEVSSVRTYGDARALEASITTEVRRRRRL